MITGSDRGDNKDSYRCAVGKANALKTKGGNNSFNLRNQKNIWIYVINLNK